MTITYIAGISTIIQVIIGQIYYIRVSNQKLIILYVHKLLFIILTDDLFSLVAKTTTNSVAPTLK
jgi:hypothetical protein